MNNQITINNYIEKYKYVNNINKLPTIINAENIKILNINTYVKSDFKLLDHLYRK